MKALYGLLALSVAAILVAVVALRWRLRRHLRRPHQALTETLAEIQPEHESPEHESVEQK